MRVCSYFELTQRWELDAQLIIVDMILRCVFIFINENINGETWSVKLNKKEHKIYLNIKTLYINEIVNYSITVHVSQFTVHMTKNKKYSNI